MVKQQRVKSYTRKRYDKNTQTIVEEKVSSYLRKIPETTKYLTDPLKEGIKDITPNELDWLVETTFDISPTAEHLKLFIEGSKSIFDELMSPLIEKIIKMFKDGKYTPAKGLELWRGFVEKASVRFPSRDQDFTPPDLHDLAEHYTKSFEKKLKDVI